MSRLLPLAVILAALLAGASGTAAAKASTPAEVVVTLSSPPLAKACARASKAESESSLCRIRRERLDAEQDEVARHIESSIPGASVRWRYRIVANGLAVALPRLEVGKLARMPDVARVYSSFAYSAQAAAPANVALIGAPSLWGPALDGAGDGIKIAVIDDGIDQTHPFFNPSGYTMPEGFPKGDAAYTTAKVIVARAFAPPGLDYAAAKLPFDRSFSTHGTHVAGIAAGNANTPAEFAGDTKTISGVAPRAYLGNYKAMTIPTDQFGLNGNSPEIVAAIEAAVADGMDVINLSLGEPEIDPHSDIVAQAVNAAVDAGVVVVAAAGNEYGENGEGSIGSPASALNAIAVAASTATPSGPGADRLASFSSSGPTPFGLRAKPELTAPGVDILSSVPQSSGLWEESSGTSMATPHAAGAVALLLQRHPSWSPTQIKSALVLSGAPVRSSSGREVSPLRQGGGRIALEQADQSPVFAYPQSLGFGFLKASRKASRTPGGSKRASVSRSIRLTDSGAAAGSCQVRAVRSESTRGVSIGFPPTVAVPGRLTVTARASTRTRAGDVDGWIVLSCAGWQQRIPFWLRVSIPQLGRKKATRISATGVYRGDTSGSTALIGEYLYPQRATGMPSSLKGPEQVFRLALKKRVQNFGVVVISHAAGVQVSPRIVRGANESRLAGLTALPVNVNPYLERFGSIEPAVATLRPPPGSYAIVFDTTSRAKAGRFRFRLWIDDRTPPKLRLLSRKGGKVVVRISDSGAGVDPKSIAATNGSRSLPVDFNRSSGRAVIDVESLGGGKHTLVVRASDYQETKNNENVATLLPNTRELRIQLGS